ncbi:GH25 family lysozyme [Kibdelosporangium lantanae]|uniref:GH25 family lysozyme n=1 Tax=Kibdelosporangium lantanae TaxID=1497396 RepID=A0ABW3M395_9PSEU
MPEERRTALTDYGIDLSHWNSVSDWNAVYGNGIRFASIKLTESTIMVDPTADGHDQGKFQDRKAAQDGSRLDAQELQPEHTALSRQGQQ